MKGQGEGRRGERVEGSSGEEVGEEERRGKERVLNQACGIVHFTSPYLGWEGKTAGGLTQLERYSKT